MFLPLSIWFFLLIAFIKTSAFPSDPPITTISPRQTAKNPNVVSFNNYDIAFCGDPHDATSDASRLMGFLAAMKTQLERLIADAQLGTHSSRYTAFFKSNRNVQKVIAQLRNLIDGNPVIVTEPRVDATGSRTPQPKLICISEAYPEAAVWMAECATRSADPVFLWLGTEAVAICPNFWNLPLSYECPLMEGGRVSREDEYALLRGMYALMVHQLVRLYNRGIRESERDHGIAYTMQEAMDLDARHSLLSATNYGFYAGGEFGDYFCLVVDGLYSADWNYSCSSGVYAFSGDEGDAWGYWW
ncbi:MAG: hypothetical protein HETSPECPRED_001748 [Heterodermia speciosa]|uniref:Effector protein n=1 Tax=Heterodermia speciosa TaxID=116794 RepID=A0A8H3EWQ7_9LECA|nr:MAG: hypothetical protein HETSPECPRED_001748 [Heterodermia speciosa]